MDVPPGVTVNDVTFTHRACVNVDTSAQHPSAQRVYPGFHRPPNSLAPGSSRAVYDVILLSIWTVPEEDYAELQQISGKFNYFSFYFFKQNINSYITRKFIFFSLNMSTTDVPTTACQVPVCSVVPQLANAYYSPTYTF